MSATAGEEVRQQVADLYRRGGFKPLARYLPEEHRDDRLSEAVALTLVMALRYAARGQRLPDAILVHHARLRATDPSRHLVSSKGRGTDALCQANYLAGETEVLHIDGVADPDCDSPAEGDVQLIGLAVRGNADPSEAVVSAFDLERWLEALPDGDRHVLELRAEGHTLQEIATALGTSISVIFVRCQRLGVQLAEAAEMPVPRRSRRRTVH